MISTLKMIDLTARWVVWFSAALLVWWWALVSKRFKFQFILVWAISDGKEISWIIRFSRAEKSSINGRISVTSNGQIWWRHVTVADIVKLLPVIGKIFHHFLPTLEPNQATKMGKMGNLPQQMKRDDESEIEFAISFHLSNIQTLMAWLGWLPRVISYEGCSTWMGSTWNSTMSCCRIQWKPASPMSTCMCDVNANSFQLRKYLSPIIT